MRFKTPFIILLIFIVFTQYMPAQTSKRAELEIKRQKLLQQMTAKTQQLNQTKQTKTTAIDQLEVLQDNIETREAVVNNLHEEISETDNIITRTEESISALQDDYSRLRTEYTAMLRKAYKMKLPSNGVVFMLSSRNFGESYRRWQYFRQYDKFRKRQAHLIAETQKSLENKNIVLTQQRLEKNTLAGINEQQKTLLTSEKQQKDALLSNLKEAENRLKAELKTAEKQSAKLNSAITDLIASEIAARKRENEARAQRNREEAQRLKKDKEQNAKSRSNTRGKTQNAPEIPSKTENTEGGKMYNVLTESPENLALSSDFRSNKGKLSTPVAGIIVRNFGKQKVLDKVTSINNGIDIKTADNADIHAVFNGKVSIVSNIAGLGNVILIQHGNYYSVYSNLSSVNVKKGDDISTRQLIGKAGFNNVTHQTEMHFEIWLEKTQLNPSVWIVK